MEEEVEQWVEEKIKDKMRVMQMIFDGFEQYIIRQLKGIQSPNLVGVQDELVVRQKSIDKLHDRIILSILVIEEIYEK